MNELSLAFKGKDGKVLGYFAFDFQTKAHAFFPGLNTSIIRVDADRIAETLRDLDNDYLTSPNTYLPGVNIVYAVNSDNYGALTRGTPVIGPSDITASAGPILWKSHYVIVYEVKTGVGFILKARDLVASYVIPEIYNYVKDGSSYPTMPQRYKMVPVIS